jgi:ornithine cyclodeaminase/alanine dehydrogenase-like protein (mu-crystallin family)
MEPKLLYLSRADVAAVGPSMSETIAAIEVMFREKGEGRVEMPPKLGIHTMPNAFIHAMPAYIPASGAAGMKWVGSYPENYQRNRPNISGLLILNDPETGTPLVVMDGVWITARRTGAATAVAARYLARPDSAVAGVLGCGVQGRSNIEALSTLFPLQRVMAYDTSLENRQRYAAEMTDRLGIKVVPVDEPRQAVAGCGLVVTAGPLLRVPHATIQAGWLEAGAFASLVDYDSYWHPAALREVDKFCTDDLPQFEQYRQIGYFQNVPPVYAELGELVTGRKPGRQSASERTIACNLGIALDDMAAAILIYRRALEQGLGAWLPF